MSIPSRGVERRAALGAAGLLTAGFLALWLLLPDKTFVFDGMMFADVIERKGVDWRASLYNPRHLLFNASFQALRDGLAALGVETGAYRLVQAVNALAGAAGLWLFGGLLRRLTGDDRASLLGAALLGATWTFGTRATEGQVYMLLSFGGLWTLWSAARLLEAPSQGRALDLAAAFALTTLFHAAAAALAPAVAAALWLAFPERRTRMLPAVALAAALILVPYCIHFGAKGLQGMLSQGAEYYIPEDRGWWTGLFLKFWDNAGLTPWRRLVISWNETARGFAVLPDAPATAALGLALWLAAAGALRSRWKALEEGRRRLVVVLALAWAGFALLNAFWSGGLFFAVIPAACLLALLMASWAPRREGLAALAAGALALAAWNAKAGLWPQSRIENNAAYAQALYLKAHTAPGAYVVIAGVVNSNLKVYIPSVAGRAREVLEYYFMAHPKSEALELLSFSVARHAEFGIPQYVLGEVFEEPATTAQMRRLWGVSPADIQRAFGPGVLLTVARRPDLSVHLFVPRGRRPELFAALGYSVLVEGDAVRREESAAALRAIAGDMTPAERRRSGALLRSSNWGFNMLRDGYAGMMDDRGRAVAAASEARFAEYRKTADFWLRAGNLFEILGLHAEKRDAWRRVEINRG